MSSLAQRLSELLSKPATFFMPFFHSPKYPTPAHAVRAALATMAGSPNGSEEAIPANAGSAHVVALYTMFEVLTAGDDYDALDAEQRSRIMSDAQLVLAANEGDPDSSLDVVNLLRELDADNESASVMGMYHSAVPAASKKVASPAPTRSQTTESGIPARPAVISISAPSSPAKAKSKVSANTWQQVPERHIPHGQSPHAAFIPAYRYASSAARRTQGAGNGKGGKSDAGELRRAARTEQKAVERARKRVQELQERRDRALREASRQWRKGDAKNHAGEVALYFAEQARELQEAAKKEALIAARELVHARREGGTRDVDLHGATASEAVVIVREILHEEPCTFGTYTGSITVFRTNVIM
jgi:hypothetical protein